MEFKNYKELIDFIKGTIFDITQNKKSIDNIEKEEEEIQEEKHEILNNFPLLKETLINLLTDQYNLFINKIDWISPKPTTFKIYLKNNRYFKLEYSKKDRFDCIINNIRYNLSLSQDFLRALKSISLLLDKSNKNPNNQPFTNPTNKSNSSPIGGSDFSGGGFSGGGLTSNFGNEPKPDNLLDTGNFPNDLNNSNAQNLGVNDKVNTSGDNNKNNVNNASDNKNIDDKK